MITACHEGQTKPSSHTENEAVAVAEKFLAAMASEDADTALSMLTDDAMLYAPFNPNGDTRDAAIRAFPAVLYINGAMQTYDNLVFEDRQYSIADNGQTVWIEAEGRLRVAATGKPYENRYVFKLDLENGKIATITEYVNVTTLVQYGVPAVAP